MLAYASEDHAATERKIYSTATIEDDFTNDSVIVVLNKEATRSFKKYTPRDFSEIDCVQVHDLTGTTVNWVERQIAGRGDHW